MADYTIELGVKLNTNEVDTKIKSYNNKTIKLKADFDPSDITTKLNSYNPKPIVVKSTLNTDGITAKIKAYDPRKMIHLKSKLSMENVETAISNYNNSKPIKLSAELYQGALNKAVQAQAGTVSEIITVKAKLDDNAINKAISTFSSGNSAIPIRVDPDFSNVNFDKVEELLKGYEARTPIKANVQINKTGINNAISEFNTELKGDRNRDILLQVKITDAAISSALSKYNQSNSASSKTGIPIDLTIKPNSDFDARLKAKIAEYEKVPVSIPAQLMPSYSKGKGFTSELQKVPIPIDVTLQNPKALNEAIKAQTGKVVPVKAELIPTANFDAKITKKTIPIYGELDPKNINATIDAFKPTSKIKVGVKLDSIDVNDEVRKLPKSTEKIEVGAKLSPTSINQAISTAKPTSLLRVNIDIQEADVNAQISAIQPTAKIKVLLDFGNASATDKSGVAGIQNTQSPVMMKVKLDREDINGQIRDFKTTSKIKVGIKADFASHSGGQTGIPQQIKNYKTNTKIRVGIKLQTDDINAQIEAIHPTSKIRASIDINNSLNKNDTNAAKVKVQLDKADINNQIQTFTRESKQKMKLNLQFFAAKGSGNNSVTKQIKSAIDQSVGSNKKIPINIELEQGSVQRVQSQIDNIRQQITQLSNIRIDFGGGGNSGGGRGAAAQANETAEAFRYLMSIINEINSKRVQLNKLTGSAQASNEIRTLTDQIDRLDIEYNNLINSLSARGIQFTGEQWSQLETAMIRAGRQIDIVQAKMADKTIAQGQTQSFRELSSILKEIDSLEKNITNLKLQGGNSNQIALLEGELRTLQSTYQHLVTTMNTPLTAAQWGSLYTQIAKTSEDIDRLKAKYADARAEFSKGIKANISNGKLGTELNGVIQNFNRLGIANRQVSDDIRQLQALLKNMDASDDVESVCSDYERFQQLLQTVKYGIKDLQIQMNEANRPEMLAASKEAAVQKLNGLFEKGSQAAKTYGNRVKELRRELDSVGNTAGVDLVNKKINNLATEIKNSGLQTKTLSTALKDQFRKYSSYFSVYTVFMYTARALRSMFEQVKSIDAAMTELKKVTDETASSYDKFLTNAASRAKEIGTTIDGLVKSTADFARLGYNFADAQGLAEVANIYAVVGDEIEGVEDATQSLISTMAAFKDQSSEMSNTEFANEIIDKFNEIGNKFAISSGGIGEAMKRSSSSLDAANNTIDESIALITAANTVVQNPDKVGNAFKTISMRIRGATTELEEAGESTEGMAESTAKMRKEIMALSGVDIMINDDTFKSTFDIMDELSKKWEDLTDIQQASIIELMAGKHQGNVFASLMQNFDIAREALDVSINSSGSAMKEHAKWSESIEARLLKIKAAWQSLSQSFLQSDFLKGLLNTVTSLVDGLDFLVDKFGTIPTLFMGGAVFKTLFNNSGFFKTINTDLTGIINKIGVANRSIAELQQSFSSGKANGGGFFGGISAVKNSMSKTLTEKDISNIKAYNDQIDKCVGSQTAWNRTMLTSSRHAQNLVANAKGGKVAVDGLTASTKSSRLATIGLTAATTALNIALTMGISLLITGVIKALDKAITTKKELAEQVTEVTEKFKEQHEQLKKLKGDYDTSDEKSMASRYEKLSKGVDDLGRNISLTADEYSEYQDILNKIAEQIPSLVSGYDEQGNAMISCKGNVDDLIEAYENLIHLQNQEVLTSAGDIGKDFNNSAKEAKGNDLWGSFRKGMTNMSSWQQWLANALNPSFGVYKAVDYIADWTVGNDMTIGTASALRELLNTDREEVADVISNYDEQTLQEIQTALKDADIDVGFLGNNTAEALAEAIENEPAKIKGIIDNFYGDLQDTIDPQKSVALAKLSEAFDVRSSLSGVNYDNISEEMKAIATQTVNSLDFDFFAELLDKGQTIGQWTDTILNQLNSISDVDNAKLSAKFSLETEFNNGEISYGEYVNGIKDAENLISGLDLDEEVVSQIKFSLNTEEVIGNYDDIVKRLNEIEVANPEEFLSDLTASEYSVMVDLVADDFDLSGFDAQALRDYIRNLADIKDAMAFETDISVDTTALEALNTALSESASAIGLTETSIDSLKSRYEDLEGYDISTLFERTASGIKVNRDELARLEEEYQNLKQADVQKHLDTLVDEYNRLTAEIDNCSNAAERAKLMSERDGYVSQIQELAEYQAQLEGVTGAYKKWIDAQNEPEDHEGYEAVASGRKDVKAELDRGIMSKSTKAYIDLLSGEDLSGKSIDEYAAAWERLGETVGETGYTVHDFFTVNDEGKITRTGIDRFFESVKSEFEGIYDEDTGLYDFSEDNLKAIQEKWGMGIDAIQLMLEAASSAGYEVDWGGIFDDIEIDFSDYETLIALAESAQQAFNDLDIDGLEDVEFNFETSNIESATSEMKEAQKIYNDLIDPDKDGNVNLEAEGAEEMRVVLSTLIFQKQQLEDSNICLNIDTSQLDESQAEIGAAISAVQNFREKFKNLEIAINTGDGIENAKTELKSALDGLSAEGVDVDIAAQLILGEGSDAADLTEKVNAAVEAVGQPEVDVGCKLDETAIGTLNSQLLTNFTPEATVKITKIDESLVNNYQTTEKTANGKVIWDNDETLVNQFKAEKHEANGKVKWDDDSASLKLSGWRATGTVTWTSGNNVQVKVVKLANGTANVNGTALAGGTTGRAFKQGDWSIKDSGTALVGELGTETLVRNGRYYTIGDSGAEFIKYKKGDIVFNHKQTEELFKNGRVTSGGGRGRAFANGSYASTGRAFVNSTVSESDWVKKYKNNSNTNNNTSNNTSSNRTNTTNRSNNNTDTKDTAKDFEETFDWIEIALERVEKAIDSLDQKANATYITWSKRNKALSDEIGVVNDAMEIQQMAYERYMDEANSVGLDSKYKKMVQDGSIDINNITDEDLANKIKEYQDWYEKAQDCKDAIEELREQEAELYAQRFENVQSQYDAVVQGYEHTEKMLDEYISQAEAKGHIVSSEYYNALIANEKATISALEDEQSELIAKRQEYYDAMRDNGMTHEEILDSEQWTEMSAEIDGVTEAIEESNTAIIEYGNSIREVDWEVFDMIQERISAVSDEAEFLIELMSNDKLFDDKGKLTEQGAATMAMHAQKYNNYMYQADDYGAEIADIDAKIASGEYDSKDQEVINRRQELLEAQRDCILAAEDEKQAIKDLTEEGINLELDALQELIDKKNEELESEKDLYEYQKKVKEQTEEIASLEKQMSAYSGDDSEEAKAKIQELKVSLEDAKTELQETEWDKYISDTSALLDTLYLEYENILNQRLDNVDYLLEQVVAGINATMGVDGTIDTALGSEGAIATAISNAVSEGGGVQKILNSEATSVGTTLSTTMGNIWTTGEGNIKSVLTTYGTDFQNKQTTTNVELGKIKSDVAAMVDDVDKDAKKKVEEKKTQTSANQPAPTPAPKPTPKPKDENKKDNATGGDGKAKVGDKVKFVSGKYYYDSYGKSPTGSKNQGKYVYITKINAKGSHPYHISTGKTLGKGDLGWLKLNQISGYATGKRKLSADEAAWTQEKGREFIVRPSDGAILTPVAKGDSVLNAKATRNIWDMANSPADFIRNNLNLGGADIPSGSNINNNYNQQIGNVIFKMDGIKNYEEMLSSMQKDKNFEKLILSMSIDRLAGKSSLAKNKSIR